MSENIYKSKLSIKTKRKHLTEIVFTLTKKATVRIAKQGLTFEVFISSLRFQQCNCNS